MENGLGPVTSPPVSESTYGLPRRIAGLIWGGPHKTFENILLKPKTAGIIAIISVINLILVIPILPKIKEFTLQTLQGMQGIPPQAAGMATTWAVAAAVIGAVLGPVLMWLVMAGLLKLFNSFTGEKTSFSSLFSIAAYSYLPVIFASIIQTVLILLTPAQNMTSITTSLALALPPGQVDKLYIALSQVDPFFLWGLALLALGSSVAMKTSFRKNAVYIGTLWLIYVLLITVFTPAGSLPGGL